MKGEMIVSGAEKTESIIVINATENNLKNVNVEIPLNSFTCVTGPSGCGKSSLIYDTIYAESQRNFLESMSGNMYGQKLMDKPKVGEIKNLHPALNVSQNYYNVNPRSTIGTVTDISYYLRSVFALYANEKYNKVVDVNFFSANNPSSCCKKCNGLGEEYVVSEELIIPDMSRTLQKGGITYFKGTKTSLEYKLLEAECEYFGIDINSKILDLSKDDLNNLLYREDAVELSLKYKSPKGRSKQKVVSMKGVIPEIKEKLDKIDTPSVYANISKYLKKDTCSICGGRKLRDEVLAICIEGLNISDVEQLSFDMLLEWLQLIKKHSENMACKEQIKQLIIDAEKRIKTLISLNLEYLNLSRNIPSLSGGEVQRVRLANQLSCSLSGMLYILDEPCKGLHYKNINSIIEASQKLTQKGNTLISIEHNKQYIANADNVIELGPVGGPKGGYIISNTSTSKEDVYNIHFKEKGDFGKFIEIKGINNNNLQNIDVNIPIGNITIISGVSGAGKSSLTEVMSVCCSGKRSKMYKEAINTSGIKKVLHVNQQPIGKTPRSTVVSYLEIYDAIRNKFASCPSAVSHGLVASDFSMNVDGGRCESCQGTGKKKIELAYLPETYIECPECHGMRFHNNILNVKYNGYNIDDVLNKPIEDVINIFKDDASICSYLNCMIEMGMGYVSLGQMSMNLSGGEAQRIKLAKCLGVKSNGSNLYILDEPTSGLNEVDIKHLENVIIRLRENKETIVIIDHNIEFISHIADYLIDLGMVAGKQGGNTIIQGYPNEVMKNKKCSWFGYENFFGIRE